MGRRILAVGAVCAVVAGAALLARNQGEEIDVANNRVENWMAAQAAHKIGTWAVGCNTLTIKVRGLSGDEKTAIGRPSGPKDFGFGG